MIGMVNFDCGVCALTDTGLVRTHNEDSNRVTHTSNGDLFVVCDGMGGHVGGATASKIGVESICKFVEENECTMPQQFLVNALEYANTQIYNESRCNPELTGMGTTACVALVRDDKVWYAHVGDSRIYYYNAKWKMLYRLTKDHSVVQALVDRGEISEEEAEHHPEKNKIRKSLGIKSEVEPEPCMMPLIPAEGDMMLLCSDGLSGMMDEEDIVEVLSGDVDVNEAGKVLVDLAKSGGGTDNITVQIIRFSGVGNREAVFEAKNKGVSLITSQSAIKNSKRFWPWIVIAISVLMIIAAVVLLFQNNSRKLTEPHDAQTTSVRIIENEAYKKEIPSGVQPVLFVDPDNGIPYHYYHREQGGDLLVNMKDFTYQIGEFEHFTKNNTVVYQAKKGGKVNKYKRDGSPINNK